MSNPHPHFQVSGRSLVVVDPEGAEYDFLAEANEMLTDIDLSRCEFVVRAPDRMSTLSVALEGLRRTGGDRARQAANDYAAIQAGAILGRILKNAGLQFGVDFTVSINVSNGVGFVNTTILDPALRTAWVEANQPPGRQTAQQTQTQTGASLDERLTAAAAQYFQLGGTETAPAGAPTAVQLGWYNAKLAQLMPAAADPAKSDEIPY